MTDHGECVVIANIKLNTNTACGEQLNNLTLKVLIYYTFIVLIKDVNG
jgi:uncharacterized phage-associated protein